ncbi:MAG: hypothetical protein HOH70_04835 [Halieaceae bacterium]|nr:hypothetical protein [Halieaceae bacterium]
MLAGEQLEVEPSIEQRIAELKDAGKYQLAESLQHTLSGDDGLSPVHARQQERQAKQEEIARLSLQADEKSSKGDLVLAREAAEMRERVAGLRQELNNLPTGDLASKVALGE